MTVSYIGSYTRSILTGSTQAVELKFLHKYRKAHKWNRKLLSEEGLNYLHVGSAKNGIKYTNWDLVCTCRFCAIWSSLMPVVLLSVRCLHKYSSQYDTIIPASICLTHKLHDLFSFAYKKKLSQWYGHGAVTADTIRSQNDYSDLTTQV